MTTEDPAPRGRTRWYLVAALCASVVAIVFATVGDGVEVADATGPRRVVLDAGHQLVWALLAGAFALAAARRRWTRASQALAVASGLTYAVFLFAMFLWP